MPDRRCVDRFGRVFGAGHRRRLASADRPVGRDIFHIWISGNAVEIAVGHDLYEGIDGPQHRFDQASDEAEHAAEQAAFTCRRCLVVLHDHLDISGRRVRCQIRRYFAVSGLRDRCRAHKCNGQPKSKDRTKPGLQDGYLRPGGLAVPGSPGAQVVAAGNLDNVE